jgi:hypothetical protein
VQEEGASVISLSEKETRIKILKSYQYNGELFCKINTKMQRQDCNSMKMPKLKESKNGMEPKKVQEMDL